LFNFDFILELTSRTSRTLILLSYPAVNKVLSLMLFHLTAWTLSLCNLLKVALHPRSSKSHILTVQSADPDAKYSFYIGFNDKLIIASVWLPVSTNYYFPSAEFVFISSPCPTDPKAARGSQCSESRFQISIYGKNVPTIT